MGSPPEFFGERVPEELATEWRKQGGFQVIGQAELLPIKMAAKIWSDKMQGPLSIWFQDQDAARRGMVKGYSSAERSSGIIDAAAQAMAAASARPWFARVATGSNPADDPSHLRFKEFMLAFLGAVRVRAGCVYT